MQKVLLWILIPVVLVTAYFSAKEAEMPRELPAIPDTGTYTEPSLRFVPERVIQGEPVMLVVEDAGTSTVESLRWNGKAVDTFIYEGKPTALIGLDLKMTSGSYPVVATLADGRKLEAKLSVGKREVATAPLGIPDNLGGNTPAAEQELLTTLAQENAIINNIPTEKRVLWEGDFDFPLKDPIVTDEYGYSRLTGASTISHKGTDFRAAVGTPVYAMNSGIVRVSREFRNYGNTIIIDHGFGVQTIYMHLSELGVKQGDTVEKGKLIGKSGKTGYSEFPHLHITVKIGGISIDPMRFLDIL